VVMEGLLRHLYRGPLQAFFACPLLMARAAAVSPRAKGNKKAHSHHPPVPWAMADCACT
jgi:hypothetical protein